MNGSLEIPISSPAKNAVTRLAKKSASIPTTTYSDFLQLTPGFHSAPL